VQGRLQGHAPDIDPTVFLTESDPSQTVPGTFLDVEIVDAHGYDLVARALSAR
jgi:hypothetical protein